MEIETAEQAIKRLGYDPADPVECVNASAHQQVFAMADHRNVTKKYDLAPGARCTVAKGYTVPRREATESKKGLGSILSMLTSDNVVPVDSDKGRTFIARTKAKG